jgi:hypothetical protein
MSAPGGAGCSKLSAGTRSPFDWNAVDPHVRVAPARQSISTTSIE